MIEPGTSLEALIVTHATKTLPELGRSDVLRYPGAPETDLLERVIRNLGEFAGVRNVLIVFDHKIDCLISCKYFAGLRRLRDRLGVRLVLSPSSLAMPSQLTATEAFCKGLEAVRSEYVLFWEHDHLFADAVSWRDVNLAVEAGAQMIRFNRRHNISYEDGVPESVEPSGFSDAICRTDYYCNGPFVAQRDWCLELFSLAKKNVPFWNGAFGGFVEGPINRVMMADRFNMKDDEFFAKYPIYLYGRVGAPPVVSHFGDFPGRRARIKSFFRSFLGVRD